MEVYKKFTTQLYEVHLLVEEEQDGMRLDQLAQTHLISFSRQQVKIKIKAGIKVHKNSNI